MCPYCGKDAPLVYRGVLAYCTACGRPRAPLTGTSVNLAGQPSKVGGSLARVLGWTLLVGGLTVALGLGALLQAIFPAGVAGWVIGGMIGVASLVAGIALTRAGRSLEETGRDKELQTRAQAVFAMAANRGGMLRALDVAQALAISPGLAESLLTDLAKSDPDRVRLEVDDQGGLFYVFPQVLPEPRVRVDASGLGGQRVAPAEPEVLEGELVEPPPAQRARR